MKTLSKTILGFCFIWLCTGTLAAEFRGLWVGGFSPYDSNRVATLIADARAGHFNALVPDMRGMNGYCYYNSRIEPKSGAVPSGYDPLADMIARAHNTNAGPRIQIHPWLIIYPIGLDTPLPSSPTHPVNLHPDWLMKENNGGTLPGGYYRLDPGHPEVQQYLFEVCMDVITNYDIDGFNFDNIRYTGQTAGYNDVSVARFNSRFLRTGQPATTDPEWMQFRRDQVTALVRKVYLSTMAIKPWVVISADTITGSSGITNDLTWPSSSAYKNLFQDWRGWMEEGIIDLNIPMSYFDQVTGGQTYANWCYFTKNHRYNRQAAMGLGLYLNKISNSIGQIRLSREATTPEGNRADGVCGFSYNAHNNEGKSLATLLNALTQPSTYDAVQPPVFANEDVPPAMPWKLAPTKGHIKGYVRDEMGHLLDGAVITVNGPVTRTLTNDATGFFGTVDLPPGSYTLTASFPAYAPATATVSIAAGAVTHQDFSLQPSGITILQQPQDRTAILGSDVELSAQAGGVKPITYQWRLNGSPLSGVTGATLVLNPVQLNHAGSYTVACANNTGSITSLVARLAVQFRIQTAVAGSGSVTLNPSQASYSSGSSVVATATPAAGFAFSHWSGDIAGTNNPLPITLTTNNVSLTATFVRSPYDLILDNTEASFTGSWVLTSLSTNRWGADYRYASSVAGASTATATYRPRIPVSGNYDVFLWYAEGSNRTTNAPWETFYSGGSLAAAVDQTTGGSNWLCIARARYFEAGTNGYVRVSNGTGAGSSVVIADAVRFVWAKTQPARSLDLARDIKRESNLFTFNLVGNAGQSWSIEQSTNLQSWLPVNAIYLRDPLHPWVDTTALAPHRFYRARQTNVFSLADFETNALGSEVLFLSPSSSGSTAEFIDRTSPNYTFVTNVFPSGNSSSKVLRASWTFIAGTNGGNPWLRLTTYNATNLPNPTVGFQQGIGFAAWASKSIYLAAGLRETSSFALIGRNGGVSGPIEWIGGITDNTTTPPLGRFIPARQWVWVVFAIPQEPLRAQTGNGILESSTGRGVFEQLTIVPAEGLGAYTLFLDDVQFLDLNP